MSSGGRASGAAVLLRATQQLLQLLQRAVGGVGAVASDELVGCDAGSVAGADLVAVEGREDVAPSAGQQQQAPLQLLDARVGDEAGGFGVGGDALLPALLGHDLVEGQLQRLCVLHEAVVFVRLLAQQRLLPLDVQRLLRRRGSLPLQRGLKLLRLLSLRGELLFLLNTQPQTSDAANRIAGGRGTALTSASSCRCNSKRFCSDRRRACSIAACFCSIFDSCDSSEAFVAANRRFDCFSSASCWRSDRTSLASWKLSCWFSSNSALIRSPEGEAAAFFECFLDRLALPLWCSSSLPL